MRENGTGKRRAKTYRMSSERMVWSGSRGYKYISFDQSLVNQGSITASGLKFKDKKSLNTKI